METGGDIMNHNGKESQAMPQTGNAKVRELALIGLTAAVICVAGPFAVPLPVSPVPISLTNLAIYFVIYVLGMKRGCISYLIYLLIGFAGVPVFSGFTAGPGKLLGPTGGYLIGFIFMALITGYFIDKWPVRRGLCFLGMAAGTVVAYGFGTVWLAYQAQMPFGSALAAGVLPFLPGDAAKIIIAMLVGPQIRKQLQRAGLN